MTSTTGGIAIFGPVPLIAEKPIVVDAADRELWAMIEDHAVDRDAARRLATRAFLHLPRLADRLGQIERDAARQEIGRIAATETTAPRWLNVPDRIPTSPLDLDLVELPAERARTLHERFHYLRSYRPGLHLAGTTEGYVAILLSFSDLDIDAIGSNLAPKPQATRARVLARVYSASWAPRNSASHMLALAARALRERNPDLGVLLTYVNPGLGFDGASYRAANWRLFGQELGTRYAYLDEDYITDRELSRRFGTSQSMTLTNMLGDRISFSRMPLPPLNLYALGLNRRLRNHLGAISPRSWHRPWA